MNFFLSFLLTLSALGAERPVYVLGDNLAQGYGASDPAEGGPAGCLKKHLGEIVESLADSGQTSEAALGEARRIAGLRPKLVFVSSGVNDLGWQLNYPGSYPVARSLKEMGQLFDTLLAADTHVLYLGLAPPFAGTDDRLAQVWLLAVAKGVTVVDGMAGLWGNEELMEDELHPNDKGYALLCERILAALGTSAKR